MKTINKKRSVNIITAEANAVFCNQIAMLLKAGIPLHEGIGIVSETYTGTVYHDQFAQVASRIHESGSLYDAVKVLGLFPAYMVSMIQIGERTGILEYVMEALSVHYNRETQVRHEVRSAVAYPLLLITMMAVVIAVLTINVLPIFTQVYDSLGTEMTSSSQAVMQFGVTVGRVVLILVMLFLATILCIFVSLRTNIRDKVIDRLVNLFPGIKSIVRKLSIARFSSVLSKLLEGGFALDEAMSMAIGILSDKEMVGKLNECRKDIANGSGFADAISRTGIYSSIHNGMLRVAGVSGKIDATLASIGESYNEEADDRIRNLVAIIEPVMVGILCLVIGAILLSVMLPLASILSSMA